MASPTPSRTQRSWRFFKFIFRTEVTVFKHCFFHDLSPSRPSAQLRIVTVSTALCFQ